MHKYAFNKTIDEILEGVDSPPVSKEFKEKIKILVQKTIDKIGGEENIENWVIDSYRAILSNSKSNIVH